MGTVNYRTSDVITLGMRPYDYDDFAHDADFMEDARRQAEEYGDDIDGIIYREISDYTEDDRRNATSILDSYDFEFFDVSIVPGYYEGFSVFISEQIPGEFYPGEREQAMRDVDRLRDMIYELIYDAGLVECWPGWCTSYEDPAHSWIDAKKALRALYAEIADIPDADDIPDDIPAGA